MTRTLRTRYLLLTLLGGCATNPATGGREISLVSESQEIALGDQTVAAARATLGVYPDSSLQRYVRGIGMRLAAITERPALPWNFEVVDDPQVNAFAAPGGRPLWVAWRLGRRRFGRRHAATFRYA